MRPHRLRLTAFGPFAQTVDVDLDALSSAGVFLLHGETGAGKTTLLDGIGFALYGRVPGERGKAKRLRSDHATADLRTSVELEASFAGRRLRIVRSPQQDKPSSRGGSTTVQAKVQLDELVGGTWTNRSTRVGEADAEIAELMGMSAEQFFQVVLLPQGEFATFLRADATKRGELLARLFGTDRYRFVEDWLAEQRRRTAEAVEVAEQELRVLGARLAQAAGVDAGEEPQPTWVSQIASAATAAAEQAGRARVLATAAQLSAEQDARAAGELAALQDRRVAALARQRKLDASAAELGALAAQESAARRAAVVSPRLLELDRRRAAALTGRAALEQATLALTELGGGTVPVAELLVTERARAGRLAALRSVADAWTAERSAAAAADGDVAQAQELVRTTGDGLAALPAKQAAAEALLAQAREAELTLPDVRSRLAAAAGQARDASALAAATADARLARDELTLARESAVALHEKALEIRESRFDSMVAELAFNLESDAPCPVCGALDHPDPSLLTGARVTRDDEDRAQADYDAAQCQVEDVAARLAGADTTCADLRERLVPDADLPLETFAQRVADLTHAAEELVAAAADRPTHEEEVSGLQSLATQLQLQRSSASADQAAAERRGLEATGRAEALADRLAAELAGAVDLEAALVQNDQLVAAAERAQTCQVTATAADDELAVAAAAAGDAAREAGFDDVEQATAAVRTPEWCRDTERQLREADGERAAVAALLADPQLQVDLEPAAPVAQTAARLAEAGEAYDAALAAQATAERAATATAQIAPVLLAALAAVEPVRAQATHVRRLADLVAGTSATNTLRMSLSSFVLAARLEEVALAASERLLRMSQGRFSLVHTDAGRGAGRAGLGLLARDTWTGQDRDTSTLSGGETFLASLALALGLADVVAAESGGSRIEALFVDEGFGTLDEETLDEVMDVLDGLREGGRVVGVVSHVAELRHRIPSQVQVSKGRTGSELHLVGC